MHFQKEHVSLARSFWSCPSRNECITCPPTCLYMVVINPVSSWKHVSSSQTHLTFVVEAITRDADSWKVGQATFGLRKSCVWDWRFWNKENNFCMIGQSSMWSGDNKIKILPVFDWFVLVKFLIERCSLWLITGLECHLLYFEGKLQTQPL